MSIIKHIYKTMALEKELSRSNSEMEKNIYALVGKEKNIDEKQREHLAELLFNASAFGQKEGFQTGFCFGVMLMAECFTN